MAYPTLGVDDKLRVRMVTLQRNQLGINVLHFRVFSNTSQTITDVSAAERISFLTHNLIKNMTGPDCIFRGIGVSVIKPDPHPEVVWVADSGPGNAAGEPLPSAVSGIITKRSLLAGRANRGRIYVPFPTEEANGADGHPTGAYVVKMTAYALAVLDTVTITDIGGVCELFPIIPHGPTVATHVDVDSFVVRSLWGTLHRRGDYGKLNVAPF